MAQFPIIDFKAIRSNEQTICTVQVASNVFPFRGASTLSARLMMGLVRFTDNSPPVSS